MQRLKIVFTEKQGHPRRGPHCFLCAKPAEFSFLVDGNTNTYYSCNSCHSHFVGNGRFEMEFQRTA